MVTLKVLVLVFCSALEAPNLFAIRYHNIIALQGEEVVHFLLHV